MYLENRKPPIIIVTPRISDTTDLWGELGVFGLFTCVVLGFTCVVLGLTCVVLGLAYVALAVTIGAL